MEGPKRAGVFSDVEGRRIEVIKLQSGGWIYIQLDGAHRAGTLSIEGWKALVEYVDRSKISTLPPSP
jgi:hypothetical protein